MRATAVQPIHRPIQAWAPNLTPVGWVFVVSGLLAVRAVWLWHARLDSDEPQHLHVVWNWASGHVAYRDFFDNHAPLFHLLMAPLARWVGERPDIVWFARAAMLPLWAAMLFLTHRISRCLFDPERALWATLALAAWPVFFRTSLEFRTDNLWAVFWLAAIAQLISRPLTRARALGLGLLFGLDLITSPKTILLLAALLVSFGITFWTHPSLVRNWIKRNRAGSQIGMCIVGLVAPCAILLAGLSPVHAAGPFIDCVLLHHANHELIGGARAGLRSALAVPLTLMLALFARHVHGRQQNAIGFHRTLVLCTGLLCFIGFDTVWPLSDWQDHLPFEPLIAASLVPLLIGVAAQKRRWFAPALIGLELVSLAIATPRQDQTLGPRRRLTHVLSLTGPDEYVVDLKGEVIFRARPCTAVFETVTRRQVLSGRSFDDLPERICATRTHVAVKDNPWFPPRGREFMNRAFILVGDSRLPQRFSPESGPIRVSGQWLGALEPGKGRTFEIAVPGEYAVLCERGEIAAILDGSPIRCSRQLAAGIHQLVCSGAQTDCAIVWARAVERGFTPFENPRASELKPLPR